MVRKPVLSEHCLHHFSQSEGGGPAQLVRASAGRPLATGALDSGLLRGGEGQRQVLCCPVVNMAPLTPQQPSQTEQGREGQSLPPSPASEVSSGAWPPPSATPQSPSRFGFSEVKAGGLG